MMVHRAMLCAGVVLYLAGCNVFTDLEALRSGEGTCDTTANPCEGCTPANECGGCGTLGDPVGGACGTCDSGAFVCDEEAGDTVCEGDEGDAALNACEGCGELEAAPDEGCGTCDSGTFECDRGNLVCRDDLEEAALNACGGCGELTNAIDDPCGTCDSGTFVCDEEAGDTVCEGDAGDEVLNECGGCGELEGDIGAECGDCGELRCNEDNGELECMDMPPQVYFRDADGDTFGNPDDTVTECAPPDGFVENGDDCLDESFNDIDPEDVNPGADEVADDDIDNNCDGFVRLGPVTYTMGSPENEEGRRNDEAAHSVELTRTIEVSIEEVTQRAYTDITMRTPTTDANCDDPECAVSCVNWFEALVFLNERSTVDGFDPCYTLDGCEGTPGTGECSGNDCSTVDAFSCDTVTFAGLDCNGYRLPTEAEWERFTRAGTTTAYFTGQVTGSGCNESRVDDMGQYCGNSGNRVHEVNELDANFFGLVDTSGNVSEWVHDYYAPFTSEPLIDPLGPETGDDRVHRGGSFRDLAEFCRSASRDHVEALCRNEAIGFRAVRTIPPE